MDHIVHGVAKSQTRLCDFHSLTRTYISDFLSIHRRKTILQEYFWERLVTVGGAHLSCVSAGYLWRTGTAGHRVCVGSTFMHFRGMYII